MDRRHLNNLQLARIKDGVKGATINRDITTLQHLFEFACDEGILKANPIRRNKKLKEIREERPRVTQEHIEAIIEHLAFPINQVVRFIWETGCRPSEALALKHESVDAERQFAIFNCRKAGDNALVALTTRAVKAIQAVPKLPGCPYVFWNPKTQTWYERINKTFQRARKKARLEWVQLKDFRSALGIYLAESGEPLHVVQRQLGHSSIRTTEVHYAHHSPEFAMHRARAVLEKRGRQDGEDEEKSESRKSKSANPKNLKWLIFNSLEKVVGGGERIRTAE